MDDIIDLLDETDSFLSGKFQFLTLTKFGMAQVRQSLIDEWR